ncbi:MAG: cellulase family glycosylhydrolase [Bacteroidales bacterium]|nr:cellulase family glycosylhydrolase [Bacteroidales bacterium]
MYKLSALVLLLVMMTASGCNPVDTPDNPEKDTRSALDRYWSDDYSGAIGIQQGQHIVNGATVPRMYLGGKLLYVSGMNCYNFFVQCHESNGMNTTNMEETVEVLKKEQVPIVRFSGSPYSSSQFHYYFDQKQKFLDNLDHLADLCDEAHILLVPSIFWNTGSVPDYYKEVPAAWGDKSSKTYAHMLSYTTDIVNTLKDHKCVAMWEFGNEFNLAADIAMAGYADIPARAVETAYKGFADLIKTLDPHNRVIASGNSIMRNSQLHQMQFASWGTDSFDEYVEACGIFNPDPMTGMSEHIYEDARVFSDKGTVGRSEQISYAKQAAAQLNKVYYVGEFTGPATAKGDSLMIRKHFISYYAQRVQVSLMWNYALKGDIEWSFKADTPYGNMAFNLMREYNERFKTVTE